MKVKEVLKKIGLVFLYIIGTLFFGFTPVFLFDKHKKDKVNKLEAELEKEKKINELEKKSASDIAADSPHSDIISSNIEREQEEFRERVRNRLNKNIHRSGSPTDN
ncbi:MAG: hypothetical protein J6W16_07320 [Methanobrevibacter sp.]|nr:hypothetical protein [Methanobrevibacter sp.]MBP5785374.1 hypothetical protein [Methanobrevibacter sp.]